MTQDLPPRQGIRLCGAERYESWRAKTRDLRLKPELRCCWPVSSKLGTRQMAHPAHP